MKLNSIAGIVCYVKDLDKTAEFYKTLGFTMQQRDADKLSVRVNWFWMDFHPEDKEDKPDFQQEANLDNKGAGLFLYIKVDDVDASYKELISKNLKPSSEPKDWPWGNREFVIRDPDGYKLVLFQKLK